MVDFIEYVVGELKSKRLSKTNAADLVRQFSRRPSSGTAKSAAILHPLLHRNTSDLSEQRYSSTFTGEEFFLADHQVKMGSASRKVLPGVAYLEMVRAAIEQAMPEHAASATLELQHTVWAQPIVVDGPTEVHIALLAGDGDAIDYEIYSGGSEDEVVHCQGRAQFVPQSAPSSLELASLRQQMQRGTLEPDQVYATCARMGLLYGAAMRSITALQRGSGQLLASLHLPSVAAGEGSYVLHPSLMDGALQAAVGLFESDAEETLPRVPFALETLRILSSCSSEMFAWVRHAAGSKASDPVTKLEIDLCDAAGKVCVQLQGFSSRVLNRELRPRAPQEAETGCLLATPVWERLDVVRAAASIPELNDSHVVLCELPQIDVEIVKSALHSDCLSLPSDPQDSIALRYSAHARACFERVQTILRDRPSGRVLVQVVVPDHEEQSLLSGLSGLLRTAALENPRFSGQVLLVPAGVTSEELCGFLREERGGPLDPLIRYDSRGRHGLRWQEVPAGDAVPVAYSDGGVYVVTGGLGALGRLFAADILATTRQSQVILTGRAAWRSEMQAVLDAVGGGGGRLHYRQVDLGDLGQVQRLVDSIVEEHGRLDGILHCAGMIADDFILKKDSARFGEILAPKVTGTCNLDEASKGLTLDFLVLFSAVAGVTGNPGQADYACANAFQDQFAAHRNRKVEAGQRHGRTRSIDWPLWAAGGMSLTAESRELLEQTSGMQPMQTATGQDAFHRGLALHCSQLLVAEGNLAALRRTLLGATTSPVRPALAEPVAAVAVEGDSLAEKTRDYLRKQLSELLRVPSQKINARAALENYGIDSILAMKLTSQLEKTFGPLSKTLFFEYQTLHELAEYFLAQYPAQLASLLTPAAQRGNESPRVADPPPAIPVAPARRRSGRRFHRSDGKEGSTRPADEPIAIIGLSGRYPEAVDVEAYWENLRDGKDCITEVPRERWDWREYFSEDRSGEDGHHYSKWGGFIQGVDEFDPLFFNISPAEAERIDPQERLFLQHAWMAIEDAGYTRASLQQPSDQDQPGQVGVYAGVMYTEYQLFGADSSAKGKRMGIVGSAASVANRVSYALNLHGPSMTLDTMCSSSLTAIHVACQDLEQGRTSLAVAGGVNVSIHPNKYLVLSAGQFISSDGHCQSFGEGGDGYIPGEGVGVVVLKRLSDAERDGDHIYGVIRGSALNHGGKTNGYSVPNPQAQTSAISRALAESRIDPRHISYIEAHGTGTKLGDPIEITALSKAFRQSTQETGFCRIGSAKSNVGHCESAAGIAGLTKVLLQMQHQQIVPSLHSAQLNPHIDFESTPFVVNQELRTWEAPVIDGRPVPRIAGISSFGAGGSNAHLIVEEYSPAVRTRVSHARVAILLSARTGEQLRQKALDLLELVRSRGNSLDLTAVAYTLQTGRESMDERLGLLVSSIEELETKLRAYVDGQQGIEDAYHGRIKRSDETLALFSDDADLQQTVDKWLANRRLAKLLELWTKGLELDWRKLYGDAIPQRIALPTYPFARERYWVDVATAEPLSGRALAVLHPLLHTNTSDLSEHRYHTMLTGEEFFLADHQVKAGAGPAAKVLPGVASLEMARAALERSLPAFAGGTILELADIVWAQPVVVDGKKAVRIALQPNDSDEIEFEISTDDAEAGIVHCQGRGMLSTEAAPAPLDLAEIERRMAGGQWDSSRVYAACTELGLLYGPSFQSVKRIHRGERELLAYLQLPASAPEAEQAYVLHPSLLDAALHAAVGLADSEGSREPQVPFALERLRIISPCKPAMVAWLRAAADSRMTDPVVKLDIDLCDELGNVCVQLRGLSSRRMTALAGPVAGVVLATPVWQARATHASSQVRPSEELERHVLLCELPNVDARELESLIAGSHCRSLAAPSSGTLAQRYSDHALACLEVLQSLLRSKQPGRELVQVVVAAEGEQAVLSGLSGLLQTAAQENPRLIGQVVMVPVGTMAGQLAEILQTELSHLADSLVKVENGTQYSLQWQEIAVEKNPPLAFKDSGVYLITGGLGALGVLFAREILEQTHGAQVILTGRSAWNAELESRFDGLFADRDRVAYRQVDLENLQQVEQLVESILHDHQQLDGILHVAGMIADGFLLTKESGLFREVLEPKVAGTVHLDYASRNLKLDFFALFSSIAGATGKAGQADYACANAFLDRFASYRNEQVAAGQRQGRTRAINWPFWQSGGMHIDAAAQEFLHQTAGLQPMQTATGMDAFHRSLALPYSQLLVAEGDVAKIRRALLGGAQVAGTSDAERPVVAGTLDAESLSEKTQDYLRRQLSGLLKLPSQQIDPYAPLEQYGIDSILALKLTNQLEKTFGPLSKTLFFEYRTIHELTGYFTAHHAGPLTALLAPNAKVAQAQAPPPVATKWVPRRRLTRATGVTPRAESAAESIAIVGLSGRYPEAIDLAAYWQNLREGKDCVTEVPKERWDWREYFSEDRSKSGHHYSKWGGFIAGVDEFDPLFFNMSPLEAELVDPQERLFLQHAWMAMEDAGYTRATLQVPDEHDLAGQVGVYVGVMYSEYQLFGAEALARGKRLGIPGSTASIANRVSYALNLHGPSMTLDTMCSSSLSAIHVACLELKLGRTSMALAGGVNVSIHPNKYLVLSAGQFISGDGHCQSFGEGGDGYIPGEGVGVVVLKRLSDAKRDGDHIYGVIRGSALNHGGKTNGYTVPNPQAQTSAISRALVEAQVDPRRISYLEAHGTGTKLGDPIEIAALTKAFHHYTKDTAFCRIGSAKSNIGHCESAAGMAGLTKVLLQMQHRQVVPSLHSAQLNPHIDFEATPFVVNQTLIDWEQPVIDGQAVPRMAGISSFGAGGSNAHLIVEEYPQTLAERKNVETVIVLSARTGEQLRQRAHDLHQSLKEQLQTVDLRSIAYTLQVGREAMEERLGLVVHSPEQLVERLQAYLNGAQDLEDVYQGQVVRRNDALNLFTADADLKQAIDKWMAGGKWSKLLELWVSGVELDWSRLYGEARPPRVSLPTYPFARERHWIDVAALGGVAARGGVTSMLHPLLHSNTSDLSEQRYRSTFTGDEFFLADHQFQADGRSGQKILPAVAYLEMARAAVENALPADEEAHAVLELRNVVWAEPIVVSGAREVSIALSASEDELDYEIYSQDGEQVVVHGQGRAQLGPRPKPTPLDLEQLQSRMERDLTPVEVYGRFARMGLHYGPSLRGITAVRIGTRQLLAYLSLPKTVVGTPADYVLHPSVMDAALQSCVGLMDEPAAGTEQPRVPFALDALRIFAPCSSEMMAWVRQAPGSHATDTVVKVDIDLCDARGNVCVQMHGLSSRMLNKDHVKTAEAGERIGSLLATPVWQSVALDESAGGPDPAPAEHLVILCESPGVDADTLAGLIPGSRCLVLPESQETIANRYTDHAASCFEQVQLLLQHNTPGKLLVQIVVPSQQEQTLFAGISGLLKTAALENPQFAGQLLLVPPDMDAGALAPHLQRERSSGRDSLVKYEHGLRQVQRWQEVPPSSAQPPVGFKEQGVYLITGGLGGLGLVFAHEILARTSDARVILTGRSALDGEMQTRLAVFGAGAGRVSYRQVDLRDGDQVKRLVAGIQYDHHRLDGVLHSAGMIADHFIPKKSGAEFRQVLEPKVTGTFHLDQATQFVELDFFVLFSSVAGALGNLGQADYATANAFMDHFAALRNQRVAAKQRHGRTLSINWPLWQDGGMALDPANRELLQETTGMQPMASITGLRAFHASLALPHDQVLVVEGDLAQLRRALAAGRPVPPSPAPVVARSVKASPRDPDGAGVLVEKTAQYLRTLFSGLLKMPAQAIEVQAPLEKYGIDSILAMKLTNELEKTFGSLSKTLFFEYQTIVALAGYLVRAYPEVVREAVGLAHQEPPASVAPAAEVGKVAAASKRKRNRFSGDRRNQNGDVAIVGVAGRYPQAENLREFWRNLREGRDCITEIPLERWDHSLYFDPDPNKAGKSYSKWGGFVADVDKFDPLFFNISPKEAALVDPQERLFLQTAWETIEDAGYTRESIAGGRVGVYVGVMWGQYELFGAESVLRGQANLASSSHASIANRVSYFFDLHGPSMALDTMCSSSLTAIHLACEALRKGGLDAAIAGGVNLAVHPYKYLSLSQGKFVASDGRCRSFGAGGDGYVPGEGVGAVLLKPLEHALRDGDQVYAVIRSSAVNHGGKTNGYSVPNPNAQADLIREALQKGGVDPRTLSYVETHGTGTSLGDPIEITGLAKAFEGSTFDKQFCPIGSVKSNIGHLESAAGIAAVTKALLQIRHRQLVPSLHAEPLNPHIDFAGSPFYVQKELAEWTRPDGHPRRVGVSSFGAGGSNAHLILEEYIGAEARAQGPSSRPEVFVLSAKSSAALVRYAERVRHFLETGAEASLADLTYTSQVGRTPMPARLAVLASSVEELSGRLSAWLALSQSAGARTDGAAPEGVFFGDAREAQFSASSLIEGAAGAAFLQDLLQNRELEKLARLWVLGVSVDWALMERAVVPARVSIPTYPFEKERYWVEQGPAASALLLPTSVPDRGKIAAKKVEEKQRTYYTPQWVPEALSSAEHASGVVGPILLLDSTDDLFTALKARCESEGRGEAIVLVQPGPSFMQAGPDVYVIDADAADPLQPLFQSLEERGIVPRVVIHHARPCPPESREEVEREVRSGLQTLLGFCQTMMIRHPAPLRILSVFSGEDRPAPLGAAMGGFVKTLTLENPRYLAKAVEIQRAQERSGTEKAGLVWDEATDPQWTHQEVSHQWDGGEESARERFVRVLRPQSRPEGTSLPLRQQGVYLITGGLGGLGLIFAEYLARQFQAKLVLVGRSAPGARQEAKLSELRAFGAEVLAVQADVSLPGEMERVVREARARFPRIHGVIHAAGVNRDSYVLRKTREEVEAVLAPKVYGAIHADLATRGEELDWLVLFSSVAGVLGNPGQSDYAFGNRFLDAYAEWRESQRESGKASGRTLSISWPLWEEGGMGISPEGRALLERHTGLSPLPTAEGIQYWEDFLRVGDVQSVALFGVPSKIASYIAGERAHARENGPGAEALDSIALAAKTETYLKTLIGDVIKLAPERIGPSDPLESFGIDSVMINQINALLEKDLGALPKTMLYQHETVRELAAFLLTEAREALLGLLGSPDSHDAPAFIEDIGQDIGPENVALERSTANGAGEPEAIAIIGIHGVYPHSATADEYWENLKQGRDLIDLVPSNRWDFEELYHPDPAAAAEGKIYCKWGGFLDDHDKFDPHFFHISTAEAKLMDPQERMFLESVWAALEDAGYSRERLKARHPKGKSADVGVFVGVTTNSYNLWAPEERTRGNFVNPTAMPWSIANRVSYFFDFSGPSLPVDTACSSSLVAIHLACESLRSRECQVAIAGGVNLYLHPSKYASLCQRRMLSLDGKCSSYGAGDEGFVPGEGVGSLILKPLSKAVEDQDHIYGVIRGSAFDHSGRSNGYSAPNPNSQAALIGRAMEKAHVHPETIGYVEGHGTGTQLGDSLEIAALAQAFQQQTGRKQFCPIGSVKANLGHSESAAGIAGLAKVLLQMEHRQLAPSIHSDTPNPNIDFKDSPFYLQHGLTDWETAPGQPRRALINSFGAGGVNACVIVEEYEKPPADAAKAAGPYLFTLSAKNEDRLGQYADRLLLRLQREPRIDLASLCYTLQTGREAMEERLAIVAAGLSELSALLGAWRKEGAAAGVYRGSLGPRRGPRRSARLVRTAGGEPGLTELASRWAAGEEVEWESLYGGTLPSRISAPTYPFARERYWVSDAPVPGKAVIPDARLHPLIAYNSSTLKEVSFSSVLSDTAFYAVDHLVHGERIFPGAGVLEMACMTANMAGDRRVRKIRDVVWMHPIRFRNGNPTLRTVLRQSADGADYVISSEDDESQTLVHSEGRVTFGNGRTGHSGSEERIDIATLKEQCGGPVDRAACYEAFEKFGLHYGPSFQTIQELYVNGSFALSRLRIAEHLERDFGQFMLHPSLVDGALQTVAGLMRGRDTSTPYLPFALDEVDLLAPIPQSCYAYVQSAGDSASEHAGVTRFDIRILNERGEVLVKITNLYVRPFALPRPGDVSSAASVPARGRLLSMSGEPLE
ncbi:MAG: SDR family NAD(P)-dependent oxidoreductase [Acidobacteriota bacterium]